MNDKGLRMSGIRKSDFTHRYVQHTDKHGDIHIVVGIVGHICVDGIADMGR
jgi:hypothetical protein